MKNLVLSGMLLAGFAAPAQAEGVFETLKANCGKAFKGEVARGEQDDAWRKATIIMHVRECSDKEIKVPLHVDDNHSRVWIISRTEDGMRLKHDHRHENGHSDTVTMYGGDSRKGDGAVGDDEIAFPVDAESIAMFKENGLERSVTNVWHIAIKNGKFSYRLTRPNRDFMVEFDLSKPVTTPPAAWDLVGH
ncbi:hypothetical protein [Kordiimonas laminariae]|uniref:hypothetical protein n=1 Tax=Kordiimonas laminariae TaxID=2917717 RepID=UPI001FF5998F|nr:hypothetical protein [Kordiimonas laminariae]MCK0067886.1 hypothetical protein [Kordiimonas laminariae]